MDLSLEIVTYKKPSRSLSNILYEAPSNVKLFSPTPPLPKTPVFRTTDLFDFDCIICQYVAMLKMFFVILTVFSLVLCNMAVAQNPKVVSAMDQEILILTGEINKLANKHLGQIRNADKTLERCEVALRNIIENPGASSSAILSKKNAYINASLFAQQKRQEIRDKLEYVIYKYNERKESLEKVGYTVDESDFDNWKKNIFWFAYCNSYMILIENADRAIAEAERREIERLQKKLLDQNRDKNRQRA